MIIETGFQKLCALRDEKKSNLILGLDPTEEMEEEVKKYFTAFGYAYALGEYFKDLIRQTEDYIVGIKPNLAFYEHSELYKETMKEVIKYARIKGLAVVMDAKRNDIMDTQTAWAKADIKNFNPDIVTTTSYMGVADVVGPFLKENDKLCSFTMAATSNPAAREFQDLRSEGLTNYQNIVLQAHKWQKESGNEGRVGFVVGSTKVDAAKNIRMIEKEYGYEPALFLCPGFGKQGGNLDFVKYAGKNAFYPISSGLTKDKYLDGKTPREAALWWRDAINAQLAQAEETPSLTEHVVTRLVDENYILIPRTPEIVKWPFLKKGKKKLAEAGIELPRNEEEKIEVLKLALKNGTIAETDFTTMFFQLRDVIGSPITSDLMAHLYAKKIKDSKVPYKRIAGVPYGGLIGLKVATILGAPSIVVRKERGLEATHDDIVGNFNKGDEVIVVEDVATTGDSLIADALTLRDRGAVVDNAFVFVEREKKAVDNCNANGITLHSNIDWDYAKHIIKKHPAIPTEVKDRIL